MLLEKVLEKKLDLVTKQQYLFKNLILIPKCALAQIITVDKIIIISLII